MSACMHSHVHCLSSESAEVSSRSGTAGAQQAYQQAHVHIICALLEGVITPKQVIDFQ